MTLIELLVVVAILMILVAFVIPRIQPASQQRRLREAAHTASVMLDRARAQALESGLPVGVRFEPLDNPVHDSYAASKLLSLVQTPPAYAGGTTESRVTVTKTGTAGNEYLIATEYPTSVGDFMPTLISIGDQMQLNGQGLWYTIVGPDVLDVNDNATPDANGDGMPDGDGKLDNGVTELWLAIDPMTSERIPPAYSSTTTPSPPVPFTIIRQPVPTMAQPQEMIKGTVVDLSASGTTLNPTQFGWNGQTPVTIMFSPSGAVERCYYTNSLGTMNEYPVEPIFLLIGRESQVGAGAATSNDTPDEEKPNWQRPDSIWVMISPQTGLVTTSENAVPTKYYDSQKKMGPLKQTVGQGIDEARQFVKQSQSMGGR